MIHLHHCRTCGDYWKCDKRCRRVHQDISKYRGAILKCPACKAEGR